VLAWLCILPGIRASKITGAVQVAKVTKQRQRLPVADSGGVVVTAKLLHKTQIIQSPCLAKQVIDTAELCQSLPVTGGGANVVTSQPLQHAQVVSHIGLAKG
jgi:hypothetical protein